MLKNNISTHFLAEKERGQSYPRVNLLEMQNHPSREIHTISKTATFACGFYGR